MIRDIIAGIFISLGTIFYIIGVIGNFRFGYILNRIHAAGIGDSLALGLFIIGCIILNGFTSTSLKLIVAAGILYFTSPISTHMLAKLEAETNPDLEKECEVEK
ncbi:MAG: monovalent cation/H(+) antiporter subunit G [Bacillota bacterium]|nr:monovalent cation/H(+) antiporter subunit G [Bacillota bacterium]